MVTRRHRRGFPCCVGSPCACMPPPNTPAESCGADVARFPQNGGLPRFDVGSASATMFRGLLGVHCTLRPACSLSPQGTLFWKCFSRSRYLLPPPPVLPAGTTEAGWESHPLKTNALSRHTPKTEGDRGATSVRNHVGRRVHGFSTATPYMTEHTKAKTYAARPVTFSIRKFM